MAPHPECPATPPRRHVARFSSFGNMTPRSSRSSHRKNRSIDSKFDTFASPHKSPFLSPRVTKKSHKQLGASVNPFTDASAPFLPTPLATCSSRKSTLFSELIEPSRNSRSLTASLQALANESQDANVSPLHNFIKVPTLRTPSPRPKLRSRRESSFDSDDDILVMREEDLKNIPRIELENPFVESISAKEAEKGSNDIDLSTHMELINHRTGKKMIQRLTEEEQRFKPRKLVFTQDVEPSVNYNVANKFLDKNIGKNFTIQGDLAPSTLGFSIFSDDNDEE